jgi:intracellular sulfur oxidation DsrE/DsrF family protein
MSTDQSNSRRKFMETLAVGATAGLTVLSTPLFSGPSNSMPDAGGVEEADNWFKKVKGKHKIVYDAPEPHDGFPIIWSWVFYKTNNQTGTPDNELTAVVVLRHSAIPFALEDKLWAKYTFGEKFKINDPGTGTAAVKNPFYVPEAKFWQEMGIEGIKRLQERGVMFCVCDMALTVNSMFTAQATNQKPEDVKKEWVAGLLPGIQLVPSGVWAIGRAQEKGCAYCFAG